MKKLFIYFILYLSIFEVYKAYTPITLTREKCRFRQVIRTIEKKQKDPTKKYYHFCTMSNRTELMPLKFKKQNKRTLYLSSKVRDLDFTERCEDKTFYTWMPVDKRYYNGEVNNNIEQYIWGFKIFTSNIADLSTCPKDLDYIIDEQFRIVPGIRVFYDNSTKRIVAAQYELLSRIPEYYSPYSEKPKMREINFAGSLQLPDLELFSEDNNGLSVLINAVRQKQKLILTHLASLDHFINSSRINIKENLTPIWDFLRLPYSKINQFLKTVSKSLEDLLITAGTTLFPHNVKYTNKYGKMITVPQLVWKAVEYKTEIKTYGIIIVMVNSIVEIEKKICDTDLCEERNWWVHSENYVYCCDMTEQSIQNLDASFMGLESRAPFKLKEQ